MNKIRKLIPEATIRIANRKEGGGVVVSDKKGTRRFKLYTSKSYNSDDSTNLQLGMLL